MNFKKISFVFLIFISLILCISAVSAENNTTTSDTVIDDGNYNSSENFNNADDIETQIQSNESESSTDNETAPAENKPVKKIATDVDADNVAVVYKKSSYFKIKIENKKTDKPVKSVKINLKVFTGSKSKTYSMKTNSKGIIKFNTKSLKLGSHKVVITSADSKYKISKTANIFVGKKKSVTLKVNSKKKVSKKDIIRVYTKKDDDEKEIKVAYKNTPKYVKLLKAIFYFKNKNTGKIVKKVDHAEFDDGKWDLPEEDYKPSKYIPIKVKVWYVKC